MTVTGLTLQRKVGLVISALAIMLEVIWEGGSCKASQIEAVQPVGHAQVTQGHPRCPEVGTCRPARGVAR